MASTMAQFLTLADADLDTIHHEEEQKYPANHGRVFNIVTQKDLYKRDAKMAGFGSPQEISEGGEVIFDDPIAPVTRRYDLQKFGLGYVITEKLWKFDRYGEVRKFERDLTVADNDHTEVYAFNLLNNATATTIATGFDGLALASTAHTRLDGGAVQANRPTSLTALSLASLQDALIAFTKFKDDRGRPYMSTPKKLLIPLDLVMVAEELLGSEKVPNSANNAVNAVRMFGLSVEKLPHITSTTYCAIVGDKHDINILWNQRPAQKSKEEFKTENILRKTEKWIGRGFGEWRGYYQINT